MKIKKGDNVLVIAGKDRGRKGKVIDVLPKEERVVIEGINLRKKHVRPRRSGEKGQIVSMPGPLHISNVKLLCPNCGKPTRVGFEVVKSNKEGLRKKEKYRVCKKCGAKI